MSRRLFAAVPLLVAGLAAASEEAVPTAVLVDHRFDEVHQLWPGDLDLEFVDMSSAMPGQGIPSSGNIAADALGFAIAGLIVNATADEAAQRRVDATLEPLKLALGEKGFQAAFRAGFGDGLARHGMAQQGLAFSPGKVETALFERLAAARTSRRFVLVRPGRYADGAYPLPVAMHDSGRQLRLAVDVDVRQGNRNRMSGLIRRDIVWYTDPLPAADRDEALAAWLADDAAQARAAISAAAADLVGLAVTERELPDVPRDAAIGVVGELGLEEFAGVLVDEGDGRVLIYTRDRTLVSLPAGRVVTGDDLVAARDGEALRRETARAILRGQPVGAEQHVAREAPAGKSMDDSTIEGEPQPGAAPVGEEEADPAQDDVAPAEPVATGV
ncbi:hypothetical protein [Arenimonas composti]|uniref:Curli production assembly/transport component CsgG n=1 Tax=Arenimonas composti TR7-09 = DSM 18010 TaxID=1121013 RepID=A0A091BHD8_9GAMM|nr:hypothetical protein [Arenimonas composti]KFN51171.1 hypothetical protein P873_03825 [Arenimonas composti TR7-09 = DSM 18010]